jgi:hypothetical protein
MNEPAGGCGALSYISHPRYMDESNTAPTKGRQMTI